MNNFTQEIYYLKPIIRMSTLGNLRTPSSTSQSRIIISDGPQCNPSEHGFYVITPPQDIIICSNCGTPSTYNFFVLKTLTMDGTLNLWSQVN